MNKQYVITSSRIKKPISILLATDLHYFNLKNLKQFSCIVEALQQEKFDYLVIGGDILDEAIVEQEELMIEFLKTCAFYAPILLIYGNHDFVLHRGKDIYYHKQENFWRQVEQLNNVTILDQDIFETEDIRWIGLTLPFRYYYEAKEDKEYLLRYFKENPHQYPTNKYNILLVHSPLAIINSKIDFLNTIDLMLSGHTHNGMVPEKLEWLFKNHGVISPFKKIYPKNVRGIFSFGKTMVIISGGITKLSRNSHIEWLNRFWKPEITKITIKPE